ncbi:MAG: DegT/DnrJ/EryC1/StrS family aminotransferase [Saprospirales bacterium]|nr:MAG: DegT/DnrJ/EryC1/StrS family aminotransferase [Saprospirales bacterium]
MVDLQGQFEEIKEEVLNSFEEILDSTQFINGPHVGRFSEDLKKYLGAKHLIPCANGTDALQIALMALDLKPGDEVITTPFTFVSTAEVIALLGLKPVFVDIQEDSFNIDPALIEEKITKRSKVIIPVHLFGQSADMEAIMAIAEKYGLFVVEDNAQAIGSNYRFADGREIKTGNIGHIGTTSFFPSKNLGCYGDGGAVSTNSEELAERLMSIANHGSTRRYYHDRVGVNSRLDTLQAAVLAAKLPRLDAYNQARREAARRYDDLFDGMNGVLLPYRSPQSFHVFHQYTLKFSHGRDEVKAALDAVGIPSGIYYPVPLHLQKAYQHCGYHAGDFPISERMSEMVLSLPMHTCLTEEQQNFIGETVNEAVNKTVSNYH